MAPPKHLPEYPGQPGEHNDDHPCANCDKWLKSGQGKPLIAAGVDRVWVCDTWCARDLARFLQDCIRWPNGDRVVPKGPPVAR